MKKSIGTPVISLLMFSLVFTMGCGQLQRRGETPSSSQEQIGVEDDFQTLPPQISNQSSKKIGLILGAGGARTLAYAGLLRSFKKNKITVSHIAGTEWSSLVAASYAISGEIHDMDWKLYKLEGLGLKFEKGFLGFGSNQTSNDLSKYFKDNFSSHRIESAQIPFTCATRSLGAHQSVLNSKGNASEILQRCLASPPFFKNYSKGASPASLMKVAKKLKNDGADIIVFVNVLDGGVLSEPLIKENALLSYAWGQTLEGHEAASEFLRNSFEIKLKNYSIFDFSKRKSLENEGESQGDRIVKSLIETYRL